MDFGSLNEFSIGKTPVGAGFVIDQNQTDNLLIMGTVLWSTELVMYYVHYN